MPIFKEDSMKYKVNTPAPVVIEIEVRGKTHSIEFYPTDISTRRKFYEAYEELKAYKLADITPKIDENGVSNVELETARELERFTNWLAERFDGIFGAGTAAIIMDGRADPLELTRFMAETAHYFREVAQSLMAEYTAPESGVMA